MSPALKEVLQNLNPAFDNRNRLAIMAILSSEDWVEFNTLKQVLDLTDGNLASHLRQLETAAFIKVQKKFVRKKTQTTYGATPEGIQAFHIHLEALEIILSFARTFE